VKITLVSASPAGLSVDALAIPVAGGQRLGAEALELDRALKVPENMSRRRRHAAVHRAGRTDERR